MANKSLTDLTARTATADSDLLHINSGGTDYKETKEYFVDDLAQRASFNNTSDIKTQVGALSRSNKLYYGICNSYGHQTETGSPINANFYITVHVNSLTSMCVELIVIGSSGRRFQAFQNAGTWTAWEELPARSEITSLNNSLANKQNDLGLTLVYYGSVPANNSYSMSGTANQAYFVVFGTWNFRKICFVDPANGNAPRVTNIGEASNLLSVTANGDWGLTFTNGTIYSMPLIIRRLN